MDGVIASLHGQALFAGLLASLPWFADPIIKHRLLKNYLLPHKGDKTGTGKSMAYRDKKFDEMLTDPQSKHENALAKGFMQAKGPEGDFVGLEDVKTEILAYLLACVNETLRASPSTPVTLPRMVSDGGLLLNNTFIPPRTEIRANPYVINRDRMVFGTDADDFNPER